MATTTDPPAPKLTEAKVTELLRQRHSAPGNGGGGEHAFLAQVRNAAGFDANRTFDAVTVGLWPSRGLPVDVWEIKVSRPTGARHDREPPRVRHPPHPRRSGRPASGRMSLRSDVWMVDRRLWSPTGDTPSVELNPNGLDDGAVDVNAPDLQGGWVR